MENTAAKWLLLVGFLLMLVSLLVEVADNVAAELKASQAPSEPPDH